MSRRDNAHRRCAVCLMHQALCVCALTPRLETRTRVVVIMHPEEAKKPTNTGALAARCLARATIVDALDRSARFVAEGERAVLLFPSADAFLLEPGALGGAGASALCGAGARPRPALALPGAGACPRPAPDVLVVPDGTWRQARRMRTRHPALAALPCVTLPPGDVTSYRLRGERHEGGLATLEAIARALTILEGDDAAEREMSRVFRVMVERTLWMRGVLRDDEVTGGVPPGARRG